MSEDITQYNGLQSSADRAICELLQMNIDNLLPEATSKIWHRQPVWFLDGNPVVGYGKMKNCIRLLFWSGQSFEEEGLQAEGSFRAADAKYTDISQVDIEVLKRWILKARDIQWDYKNIVKRKGQLIRL